MRRYISISNKPVLSLRVGHQPFSSHRYSTKDIGLSRSNWRGDENTPCDTIADSAYVNHADPASILVDIRANLSDVSQLTQVGIQSAKDSEEIISPRRIIAMSSVPQEADRSLFGSDRYLLSAQDKTHEPSTRVQMTNPKCTNLMHYLLF